MRDGRGAIRAHRLPLGVAVPVGVFLHVPRRDALAVGPPGGAMRRLPRPPLLRALSALPAVQGAQGARPRALNPALGRDLNAAMYPPPAQGMRRH